MHHDRSFGARDSAHAPTCVAADRSSSLRQWRSLALLALALALVVGGCAATRARAPLVVLQSSAYGCGAEPGLGCGLELAPVLERLDEIEGVETSHVTWDGRHFRLALQQGADEQRVVDWAIAVLEGGDVRRVDERWEHEELEDHRRWFDAEETLALSRHEAGVLAQQHASALGTELALDAQSSAQLLALLRAVLLRAFEQAHAQGGGLHLLHANLLEAREHFEQGLGFLHPGQRARVADYLERQLGGEEPAEETAPSASRPAAQA